MGSNLKIMNESFAKFCRLRHSLFQIQFFAKIVCSTTLISTSFLTQGQDYPRTDYNLEKLADEIFPIQDLDLNYEELYENLAQLLTNPVDLNLASAEELRSLFVLREAQIEEFIRYRQEQGRLFSIYELQAIPGFDLDIIYQLIPFTIVSSSTGLFDKSLVMRIADYSA